MMSTRHTFAAIKSIHHHRIPSLCQNCASRTIATTSTTQSSSSSHITSRRLFSSQINHQRYYKRNKHASSLWSSQQPTQVQTHQRNLHSTSPHHASGITADTIMESLNDLYATAKDEFEIAAEETEKKTVYAADDREGAREALTLLKEGFEKAVAESDPEVAKEVQGRVGQRIRELENAVVAMEERALED